MFIFALRQSEPPNKMNPILYSLPLVRTPHFWATWCCLIPLPLLFRCCCCCC